MNLLQRRRIMHSAITKEKPNLALYETAKIAFDSMVNTQRQNLLYATVEAGKVYNISFDLEYEITAVNTSTTRDIRVADYTTWNDAVGYTCGYRETNPPIGVKQVHVERLGVLCYKGVTAGVVHTLYTGAMAGSCKVTNFKITEV